MKARILDNQKVSSRYFKMTFLCPEIVKKGKAGQFLMLRVNEKYDPLLPRAFAIHRTKTKHPHSLEILYQTAGRVTRLMSYMKSGEELSIIGPLGNGFSIAQSKKRAIIIAGGIGVAPVYLLAEALKKANVQTDLFVGGKSKKDILCVNEFQSLGVKVKISTDDGSRGKKGMASELLKDFIKKENTDSLKQISLYACGPHAMLQSIAGLAETHSLPCQISMEAKMACGMGACQGCIVKTKASDKNDFSYQRVCKEGSVFNADEILWK